MSMICPLHDVLPDCLLYWMVNSLNDLLCFHISVGTMGSCEPWPLRISSLIFLSSIFLWYSKDSICNKSSSLLTLTVSLLTSCAYNAVVREHRRFGQKCPEAIGRMGYNPYIHEPFIGSQLSQPLAPFAKIPWKKFPPKKAS